MLLVVAYVQNEDVCHIFIISHFFFLLWRYALIDILSFRGHQTKRFDHTKTATSKVPMTVFHINFTGVLPTYHLATPRDIKPIYCLIAQCHGNS